jgi:hypothetical protein
MEIEKEGPIPVQGAFSFCFLADRAWLKRFWNHHFAAVTKI